LKVWVHMLQGFIISRRRALPVREKEPPNNEKNLDDDLIELDLISSRDDLTDH